MANQRYQYSGKRCDEFHTLEESLGLSKSAISAHPGDDKWETFSDIKRRRHLFDIQIDDEHVDRYYLTQCDQILVHHEDQSPHDDMLVLSSKTITNEGVNTLLQTIKMMFERII